MWTVIQIILIFILLLIAISFIWFDFIFLIKNSEKFKKIFNKALRNNDIVIIFNSGGWGTIDYSEAFDLYPICKKISEHLSKKKFKVAIVQYYRTSDNLIGKIGYLKDYFFAFPKESKQLAGLIEKTRKKIILIGLSNGALLADEVKERLSEADNVFSIELGKPFFGINSQNKNILRLNNPEDHLSNGKRLKLFEAAFITAPFIWIKNMLCGKMIPIGAAVKIEGHEYLWSEIGKDIISFVNKRVL